MFLKKGLFNFYDIIKRFIINDFETNRNENTMSKNQPKRNISEKPKSFRSNFRFEHIYSSAAKCSNPDHPNWHHSVQTSGNLSFSSTLKMYKFLRKTYRLWKCMNNIVPSNETRLYWSCCRTLHLLTVQAFSVLKYFHSNHSLLHNYISGGKEAVHIKYG